MNVVRFSDHIVCAFAAVLLADCSLLIMYCFWFGVKWFRTKHADLQCAKCCLWYHNFCWHSLAVGNCCDNFFIIVLLKSSIMKTYWENISAVCCRYVIIIILIYKYCHLCGTYRKMLYCYYYAVVTGEPIEVHCIILICVRLLTVIAFSSILGQIVQNLLLVASLVSGKFNYTSLQHS